MPLDELKEAWAAHGAALEARVAVDEGRLQRLTLRKLRFAFAPYVLFRALDVALGTAALIAMAPVLWEHVASLRYVLVGGALAVFALGVVASSAYLAVSASRLDYDGPVTALQRHVERTRLVEYRAFKWALLGGVLLWLPGLLLLVEALSGFEALARVDLAWLVANLAVGLAALAIGQILSKRYVERADLAPWARRLVDALASRTLRSASSRLAELASFEREDTPPAADPGR